MISLGLIGCGEIAESGHLPTILNDSRFQLKAVCDIDRTRADLFASRVPGSSSYANWRELLAREQLDAIVLALPPEISPDVVVEALARKLAVLDEKPLASSVAEGLRVQRAVEESGGIYQIGFALRYGDWVERLRQMSPSLGLPLQMTVEIYDERLNLDHRLHLARIDGFIKNSSAMTHEGSHVVDYANLWNDSPWTRVSAVARQTLPLLSGPNVWNAEVDFEDHSKLSMKIAWLLPELPPSTVTMLGPEGRLDFNCVTGSGHVDIGGVENHFETSALAPAWNRQYDAFASAIERGLAVCATVDDGLRALEVTAACEMSARTGDSVVPEQLFSALELGHVDSAHPVAVKGKRQSESHVQSVEQQS